MNRQELIQSLKQAKAQGFTQVDLRSSTELLQAEYDRLNSVEVETEKPEQKVALTPQQLEQLQQDLNEIGAELADRLLDAMTATDTALSAAKQLAERSPDSLYEAAKQQAISQLTLVEQRHLSRLNRANLSLPFFSKALKGVKSPQSFDEINELAPVYLKLIRQHLQSWQVFSTTRWESANGL